ncbi:uncharacterized protein G2W53_031482 [Senna tora]|uniref:Uncharacterized protein n=1 Tax=Senna tora TaxID=362788 RepID=A0A834T8W2_9FABA|nr:uncharacterized protein G2W53_031482 [Senna tora]
MGVFYHEEPPSNPAAKRCRCLAATLKEVFSQCRNFAGRLSTASLEEDFPISDFDEEQEVVVSAVKSRAMERLKQKPSVMRDSFSWVYSPATKELYIARRMAPHEREDDDDDEKEEFFSVKSCFSCRSSVVSGEPFYSVKTNFSPCSSMNDLDFSDYWRRSIIQELCHCEGWPFGLCRKAVLLPPLPKSPSDSWLWRKKHHNTKDV